MKKNSDSCEIETSNSLSFFAKAMHELRGQIHGIVGISDFLCSNWNDLADADKQNNLHEINLCTRELDNLINSFLLYTVTRSDDAKLSLKKVDLLSLIQKIVQKAEFLIPKDKNLVIRVLKDKLEYPVLVDEFWIGCVIKNLLYNAIKYSQQGCIDVSLKFTAINNSKYLECCIEDSGTGVSEENLQNIFVPFYQEHNSKDLSYNSKVGGLGLAICKDIINKHFGDISAQNKPVGQGLIIRFIIPAN